MATLEGGRTRAASTSIPLAGDESVETPDDALRAAGTRACELTGIKLAKVGGLVRPRSVAEILPAYASSAARWPGRDCPGARRSRHPARGAPPTRGPVAPTASPRNASSPRPSPSVECELRDGMLHPPAGPGLGVEIDEDALQLTGS